jgi:hypothetical protein
MRPLIGSIICTVLVAGSALAESGHGRSESGFRCESGQLVSLGDDMLAVEDACGAPDAASQRFERRSLVRWLTGTNGPVREERSVDVTIDEWIYDRRPTRFRRVVQFENGRVIHIGAD